MNANAISIPGGLRDRIRSIVERGDVDLLHRGGCVSPSTIGRVLVDPDRRYRRKTVAKIERAVQAIEEGRGGGMQLPLPASDAAPLTEDQVARVSAATKIVDVVAIEVALSRAQRNRITARVVEILGRCYA